jgi:serine protease Do
VRPLVLLALFACSALSSADAASVFAKVRKSVLKVQSKDSVGSAFLVGDGTMAVTAEHVVASGAVNVIGHKTNVTVLLTDKARDLAILKFGRKLGNGLPILPGRAATGTKVYAIGSALGVLDLSISEGIVSGYRSQPECTVVQFTAPISEGCSGGPVLDDSGRVVAVVSFAIEDGQNLNFGTASGHVAELIAATAKFRFGPDGVRTAIGKLGITVRSTSIYAAANTRSRVYYRLNANERLVIDSSPYQSYYRVLMSNGWYGYVRREHVKNVGTEVTVKRGDEPRPKTLGEALRDTKVPWQDALTARRGDETFLQFITRAGGDLIGRYEDTRDPKKTGSAYLVQKLIALGKGVNLSGSVGTQMAEGLPVEVAERAAGDRVYLQVKGQVGPLACVLVTSKLYLTVDSESRLVRHGFLNLDEEVALILAVRRDEDKFVHKGK